MRICAVTGCGNSTRHLHKWMEEHCKLHNCNYGTSRCICSPPFRLLPFPTQGRDDAARHRWIKLINRTNRNGRNWQPDPKGNSRVCSKHFPDGVPTLQHPDPVLQLGYTLPTHSKPVKLRKPPRHRQDKLVPHKTSALDDSSTVELLTECQSEMKLLQAVHNDHDYNFKCQCQENCFCVGCTAKQKEIVKLTEKVGVLEHKVESLQCQIKKGSGKNFSAKNLKSDTKVQQFTGLRSVEDLEGLLQYVKPKARKMQYWEGKKKVLSTKVKRIFTKSPCTCKPGPKTKLCLKDQLVIVLMKLRLGVSISLLAALFGISKGTCSKIFNTWIKFLGRELRPLVFWPDRDMIKSAQPKHIKERCPKLRCILDCTEVFIERPRHLQLQALTWSDYKKHNTVKVLVGIAPNGMITFLSKAWGGRSSDANIVRKSGFLEYIDPGDCVMVDKGIAHAIQADLMFRQAHLEIPPPSGGYMQMTREKVRQTKKVANIRIHVERAIGHLKQFQILKNTLPITLVPHVDDIFTVCAALCNMMPPLVTN